MLKKPARRLLMCMLLLPMATVSASAGPGSDNPENLLTNPRFADGLTHWTTAPGVDISVITEGGRTALHIKVPSTDPPAWNWVFQSIAVIPGQVIEATADVKRSNIAGGHGVMLALEFCDPTGTNLLAERSGLSWGEGTWRELLVRAAVPKGATECRVALVLQGTGQGWYSKCRVRKIAGPIPPPPEETVVLTVTGDVSIDSLIGFGAEDDGFFYTDETAAHGVTEADHRRRDERIRWLDPDFVRMLMRYDDWYPGFVKDTGGYTFDSDEMQSHYHALDLYQSIGAKVNLVTRDWVMNRWNIPDWRKLAHAAGDMMEHLIVTKGYTCIDTWTPVCEPDGHPLYKDYAVYAEFTRLAVKEFKARGLDLNVVGSDSADTPFFTESLQDDDLFPFVDIYATHRYFVSHDPRLFGYFFRDHLDALASRTPVKPFYLGEFGFIDARTADSHINPAMKEYGYALWTTDLCIQGLNMGVPAFGLWTLDEMPYPGGALMVYGMWDFLGDWAPRPVYHAYGMFMRRTDRGDAVRRTTSSAPGYVKATCVGDTVFWVSHAGQPLEVRIEGTKSPNRVRIMEETTLAGDRDTGTIIEIEAGQVFIVPARSFGYAWHLGD